MDPSDRLPADTPVPPLVRTYFASFARIRAALVADMARRGLAREEFDVVAALGGSEGMTCKAIAARIVVPNPTLTRTLGRMEAKGLVAWRKAPEDGRLKIVSLTAAGQAAYERCYGPHLDLVRRSVAHLSPEEQGELERLLTKLVAGFLAETQTP